VKKGRQQRAMEYILCTMFLQTAAVTPGTSEWTKALISSGVGLVAGLLSQPLAAGLTGRVKRRMVRHALYSDLGRLYHVLNRVYELSPPELIEQDLTEDQAAYQLRSQELFKSDVKVDAFTHYINAEASAYWTMPEALTIQDLYQEIGAVSERYSVSQSTWGQTIEGVAQIFNRFNFHFDRGSLEETLLLKYRKKHRETTAERVTKQARATTGPLIRDSH
jgi:hypothetical protein